MVAADANKVGAVRADRAGQNDAHHGIAWVGRIVRAAERLVFRHREHIDAGRTRDDVCTRRGV